MTLTKAQRLKAHHAVPIAPRTLAEVQETLAEADKFGTADQMARLFLKHGNITIDARAWLAAQQLR